MNVFPRMKFSTLIYILFLCHLQVMVRASIMISTLNSPTSSLAPIVIPSMISVARETCFTQPAGTISFASTECDAALHIPGVCCKTKSFDIPREPASG